MEIATNEQSLSSASASTATPPDGGVTGVGPKVAERLQGVPRDLVLLVGGFFALCLFLTVRSDVFLTSGNVSNVLQQAAVLAVIAFGVTVVIVSGNLDLSVGAAVALVSVIGAMVMRDTGSIALGVLACLGAGIGLGLVNGILVSVLRVPSFIATLGMLVVTRGVARWITDGRTIVGVPTGFVDFMNRSVLGVGLTAWLAGVVLILVHVLLRHTHAGVRLYAVGGNAEAARLAGISLGRVRVFAFVVSGLTVAVAAIVLLGRLGAGQPNGGNLLELYAVAAVVLGGTSLYGGTGSVFRTLLGVMFIAVIQNGLNLLGVNADMQMIILGAVFIGATALGANRTGAERR
jgi:ribose transport system permease protein